MKISIKQKPARCFVSIVFSISLIVFQSCLFDVCEVLGTENTSLSEKEKTKSGTLGKNVLRPTKAKLQLMAIKERSKRPVNFSDASIKNKELSPVKKNPLVDNINQSALKEGRTDGEEHIDEIANTDAQKKTFQGENKKKTVSLKGHSIEQKSERDGKNDQWQKRRKEIRQSWLKLLGNPVNYDFERRVIKYDEFETREFKAEFLLQQNSPTTRQRMLLMKPHQLKGKAPGAVVPFYDCDSMCGYDLMTKEQINDRKTAMFGLHLVKLGFVVLCVETYPFNNRIDPVTLKKKGFFVWAEAAKNLKILQPDWSGMGKLTADAQLALDYLLSLDCVDSQRIAMAGHSLGGKVAFYAGCLDDRVKAILVSDFGMRLQDSNWDDSWYWGTDGIKKLHANAMDHSSLLALHAPGLFLLIAGQADGEQTIELLNKAKSIYCYEDANNQIHIYNHATGHQPTWDTVKSAFNRLAEEFHVAPLSSFK